MFSARTVMGTGDPARTMAGTSSVRRRSVLLDRVDAAELPLDRCERAEHERLVVRASTPEDTDERHGRPGAGEHRRSAVTAADDGGTGRIADEALAVEVDRRPGDARVDAAPVHRATRPPGGAPDLVDAGVEIIRRAVVLGVDREHRCAARDREAPVVRAGRLRDLAAVRSDARRVAGARGI